MNQTADHNDDLAGKVIGLAGSVHQELGPCFFKSACKSALASELERKTPNFERQKHLQVFYKGAVVGHYAADVFVESKAIVEPPAVQNLVAAHQEQLVHSSTAARIGGGLLQDFGSKSLQFKKKCRHFSPSSA